MNKVLLSALLELEMLLLEETLEENQEKNKEDQEEVSE